MSRTKTKLELTQELIATRDERDAYRQELERVRAELAAARAGVSILGAMARSPALCPCALPALDRTGLHCIRCGGERRMTLAEFAYERAAAASRCTDTS